MRRIGAVLFALLLVAAACGGGDDEATPTSASEAAQPADEAVTPTQVEDSEGEETEPADEQESPVEREPSGDAPDPGSGSESNFCGFIAQADEELNPDPAGFDPDSFRELIEQTQRVLERAQELAPDEVRSDVALIAEAYEGFASLLEEYDYNIMAVSTAAADDPRLLALESDELAAASARIGQFCGVDLGVSPDVGAGDTGDETPGGDQSEYGDIPNVLVPPDVVEALDMGSGAVLFRSDAPFDAIVDFYTDALGTPFFVNTDEQSGVWQGRVAGVVRSVTVGPGDGVFEVLVARIGG